MCVLLTLFVYQVSWPRWEECSLVSFSFQISFGVLWFSPSMPLCLCLFFFGPPTQNTEDLFFWFGFFFLVNHTWILSRLWTHLALLHQAGESHPNYLNYWLLWLPGCDLHEVTFSSNMQTFATFFFWKTINSAALSSASLFFFALHHSLSHFLWLLSPYKQRKFTAKRVRHVHGGEIVAIFFKFNFWSDNLLIDGYSSR